MSNRKLQWRFRTTIEWNCVLFTSWKEEDLKYTVTIASHFLPLLLLSQRRLGDLSVTASCLVLYE